MMTRLVMSHPLVKKIIYINKGRRDMKSPETGMDKVFKLTFDWLLADVVLVVHFKLGGRRFSFA